MITRAGAIWLALLVLAIANGAMREALLSPRLGPATAHVVSTATLCAAILVLAWFSIPWIGAGADGEAWTVGVLWTVLTLGFEFLAGHYLFGSPWSKLLADYDLTRGRVWLFVPLVTLIAPAWMTHLRSHA